MTEINNREVKKLPLEVYHRMELFWHEPETADIVIDLVDGEGEASPLTERLISVLYQLGYRLFPQPLDDKELGEKIAKVQRCLRNCQKFPSLCHKYSRCKVAIDLEDYGWADQILALLPSIEEARREALKEVG